VMFVVDAKATTSIELCVSLLSREVGLEVTMGIGPRENSPQQGSGS
jgi:hypothetical protein